MRIEGYRINGYNATYEQTYFDVREGKNAKKNRVLEVEDLNSGITFVFEDKEYHGYVRRGKK